MLPPHVILRGFDTLPIAPEVVARLAPLLAARDLDSAAFERAVKFDPVLTANLLQAANRLRSPGATPVATLEEAIALIGLQRLVEVAVGASLRRTLPARLPGYGISAGKFWIHCIAVATLGEAIARRIDLPTADLAFSAGLLHDIGQLAIGDFFAENMPESDWWTFGTPDDERTLLSCNHGDIGQIVAERWNLPAPVIEACRWHHEPARAPKTIDRGLNTVIHAADALAYGLGFKGVGYPGEALDEVAPAELGLTEPELLGLAQDCRRSIGQNAVASGMGAALDPS
ncbi:MAG: HDOD domain-containing protein [Holophagaceae bacterium]|uniref:HDOD domain-containing protein n=1 Tax=Candidatus Geothrix skivensis TaxID=2954439 RepID=A0A9D7SFV1_9BACT|nr:HDOD domain-containing protein [Candidatus Geothrix skivensis]